MLSTNNLAVSSPVMDFLHGIKCDILVNRSTITRIESKLCEIGRSVIKSIDNDVQGLSRTGSGCNSPCGRWRGHLARERILHDLI